MTKKNDAILKVLHVVGRTRIIIVYMIGPFILSIIWNPLPDYVSNDFDFHF